MSAGFQCKKFYIAHDQCAMKVGTDGLLLGAWAPLPAPGYDILDIGAGSGLISLMLAQRTAGANPIDAIELDDVAAQQAADNVANSPWPAAVRLIKGDILTYQSNKRYRLIVSNPPFFHQSLPSADTKRKLARHTDSLPYSALLDKAAMLLETEGCFVVILPADYSAFFVALSQQQGWSVSQRCEVYSKVGKVAIRTLLVLVRAAVATQNTTLTIHADNGQYSAEYIALLKAFYLKF
ncbi:tRNA1(Val) (adenine(37)-N6)-methyltransferase [Rheinheimera baltica]|uniref:tRNA1(Val) (adenine(37)-N6)-methyltransferase n=1 Tax=Rheinheimera baltica TaxID=67576 RepID=UPI000489BE55|nr:methyltransferase [Rheinheimera baltica]